MTNMRPGGPMVIALLAVALVGAACGQPDSSESSLSVPNIEGQTDEGSTTVTPAPVSPAGQEDPDDAQRVVVVGSSGATDSAEADGSTSGSATDDDSAPIASSTVPDKATSSVTGPAGSAISITTAASAATTVPATAAPSTTAPTTSTSSASTTTTAAPSSTTASSSPGTDPAPGCTTSGGPPAAEGFKQWCWSELAQEIGRTGAQHSFANGHLSKSLHYNPDGVFVSNGRLHFSLNPTTPSSGNTHYRQEIRENPANSKHPLGTEMWWGFDYRFGDDYTPDELPWIMWQAHGYFSSPLSPLLALEVAPSNYQGYGNPVGELFVGNQTVSTANPKKARLGVVPRAGQTLSVVIHTVWGDESSGLLRVWIDGNLVYDEQERTVYVEQPEGGYWKLGIYKWRWKSQDNVDGSASRGIHELNTSIGSLKVIKRSPSNPSYLANEYNTVKP